MAHVLPSVGAGKDFRAASGLFPLERLAPLLLFAINLLVSWRFLNTGFTGYPNSLEPFFYAIAAHLRDHWAHLGWWPQWNCGMPFLYTYQPLLHGVVAAASGVTGVPIPRMFHVVMALFYSAGPVTLFYLARRFSGRFDFALSAGLLYSLWSPSALFISYIATDIGGPFHAQRLRTIAASGNAPYVAGLTLLPLALLLLDRAAERATPFRLLAASLTLISVPLTNIPAALSLAMALAAYCLASSPEVRMRTVAVTAACLALGFCLSAPLLPPSSLMLTARNTQQMDVAGQFEPSKFIVYSAGVLGLLLAAWGLIRFRAAFYLRFSLLFLLITATVVLAKVWGSFSFLAQADRFHLVLEMAIALALAGLAPKLPLSNGLSRRLVTVAALIAVCLQVENYRLYARKTILRGRPETRSEYKIAQWLRQHAGQSRVMVHGSVAFSLNAFTATPQVNGCCDQNLLFPAPRIGKYVFGSDDGAGEHAAAISLAWLKTLGVRFVAMCGPRSDEYYHDVRHPEKFRGILPVRWQEGDNTIYEIPGQTGSLAHWITQSEVIRQMPVNGIDTGPLLSYAVAVSDPARASASFDWTSTSDAIVRSNPAPGGGGGKRPVSVDPDSLPLRLAGTQRRTESDPCRA